MLTEAEKECKNLLNAACPRCEGCGLEPNVSEVDCKLCGGGGLVEHAVMIRIKRLDHMMYNDPLLLLVTKAILEAHNEPR